MKSTKRYLSWALLLGGLALFISAQATPESLFLPPTSLALDDSSVVENAAPGTLVGRFLTTDPDAEDNFTYALSEGEGSDDNGKFRIEGDSLLTDSVFNYEDDSVFVIQVTTTDVQEESYTTSFVINILDEDAEIINTPPTNIALTNNTVAENAELGTQVGFLSAEDAEDDGGFTYRLVAGEGDIDNASFRIDSTQLSTNEIFDFEVRSEYRVRIETTDTQDSTFSLSFTIVIEDVPEADPQAPTDILLSDSTVAENQADSTLIGTLSSVSPIGNTDFVYDLVAGDSATDNGSFIIDGDQLLAARGFDFEAQATHLVRIQTADLEGNTFSKGLLISVEDVDESLNRPPVGLALSNSAVAEEQPVGTLIGTFTTEDPDDSIRFTYTKAEGEGDIDNPSFRIVDDQLLTNEVLDFETKPTYQLRVQTTDQVGAPFVQTFTIEVTDFDETVNQPPTDIELDNATVAENQSAGSLVGQLSTTDLDHTADFVYTLTEGEGDTDNVFFQIIGNSLVSDSVFDFETQRIYQVRITTTDPAGAAFARAFTVQVTDFDETADQPPNGLILSDSVVSENGPIGTEVGYFAVIAPDLQDRHAVTLVAGEGDEGNNSFQIIDKALVTRTSFDYENQDFYSIRVQAKDSAQGTFTRVFVIAVTDRSDDENQIPTNISLLDTLFSEGPRPNALVSILSVEDADADDSHTLALVSGEGDDDNAFFTIEGDRLLSEQVFDYNTQASYQIRVRADDRRGGILEKVIVISVANPNGPPEVINPLLDLRAEVGISFTDTLRGDAFRATNGDTLAYAVALADGNPLPDWLTFDADTRVLSGTPPEDAPDSLELAATATDARGQSVNDPFTLTLTREVVTSVEDEATVAWTVYPVPTTQRQVTLRGPLASARVQLRLLDTQGRLLRSYTVEPGSLSEYAVELPTTLSPGTYLLEIETPESVARKRIVFQ